MPLVRDLVAKGVRFIILTNSLASDNHVPVHAGYTRYRRDVIEAGPSYMRHMPMRRAN